MLYPAQLPVYIPVLISCLIISVTLGAFALVVIRRQQSLFRSNQRFYHRHLSLLMEEHKRIAADLHDTINPRLHLALVILETIKKNGLQPASLPEEAIGLVRESIVSMGHIVQNINDEKIIRQGLQNSLQLMIGRYRVAGAAPPAIHFDYSVSTPVPPGITYTVFQVVQELFSNTFRHAGARAIELRIRQHREMLYLHYTDDGRGIDKGAYSDGLGLQSMQNRIARLGGTFNTRPGKGLSCFITIPLNT